MTEAEAQALLHGAGVYVEGDRVIIPARLVEEVIQSVPEGVSIYMRAMTRIHFRRDSVLGLDVMFQKMGETGCGAAPKEP